MATLFTIPQGANLSTTPMLPNPSGAPPNFTDPPSNFLVTIIPAAVFALLRLLAVIIRIWFNFSHVRKLEIDDFTCVFAWITMTAHFLITTTLERTARHSWDTPMSAFDEGYLKRLFVTHFIIGLALWLSKATILFLYIRIFRPACCLCVISYTTLTISFIIYGINCPLAVLWCAPSPGQPWDLLVYYGCHDLAIMGPIQGALNLAVDCVIIFLPLPIVRSLNLSPRKKIGLVTIFSVGILSMIASAIALPFRVRAYLSADTYYAPQVWVCTSAECYTTILSSFYGSIKSFTSSTRDAQSHTAGEYSNSPYKGYPNPVKDIRYDSTTDLASNTSGHSGLPVPDPVKIYADKNGHKHLSTASKMGISKVTTVEQISTPRDEV